MLRLESRVAYVSMPVKCQEDRSRGPATGAVQWVGPVRRNAGLVPLLPHVHAGRGRSEAPQWWIRN